MSFRRPPLRALAPLATILAAGLGCSTPPSIPQSFNFNRPADSAQICLRVKVDGSGYIDPSNPGPVTPLLTVDCIGTIPDSTDARDPAGTARRLFALVTQTDRGEVAVVNLHPTRNTGVVDNNRRVPGYTFIPVGAFPSAVEVHPLGTVAYVANTGDHTISLLDTSKLLGSGPFGLSDMDAGTRSRSLQVDGHPLDMALDARGGRVLLYVLVGDRPAGPQIVTYDVTDPLSPPAVRASDFAPITASGTGGAMDGGVPAGEGGTGALQPEPSRLVVAPDDGALYVTDRATPWVHRFAPAPAGSLAVVEMAPLPAGSPTDVLAVTPRILYPGSSVHGKRFVYASSYPDRDLLVIDVDASERIAVNRVLDRPECAQLARAAGCRPIDPRFAADRVPLFGPVVSLTVALRDAVWERPDQDGWRFCGTPTTLLDGLRSPLSQDVTADPRAAFSGAIRDPGCQASCSGSSDPACVQCADTCAADTNGNGEPTARAIRGVQVIAGLRTGGLQMIDVADPDRACTTRIATGGAPTFFQPHSVRSLVPESTTVTLYSPPTYYAGSVALLPSVSDPQLVPLDVNGTSRDPRDPVTGLSRRADSDCRTGVGSNCPPGCTADNSYCIQVLQHAPDADGGINGDGTARIGPRNDTWQLTSQGILPGLSSRAARLEPGTGNDFRVLAPGAHFGRRGVRVGDRFVISDSSPCISDPLRDASVPPLEGGTRCVMSDTCSAAFGTTDLPRRRDLRINAFDEDSLQVTFLEPGGLPATPAEMLARCYPEIVPFEVRVPPGQWTVTSYLTTDGAHPPARLFEGVTFSNESFRLQIDPGWDDTRVQECKDRRVSCLAETARDRALRFSISSGLAPALVDTGTLPISLHYSCLNHSVYAVDEARGYLVEFSRSTLESRRLFN